MLFSIVKACECRWGSWSLGWGFIFFVMFQKIVVFMSYLVIPNFMWLHPPPTFTSFDFQKQHTTLIIADDAQCWMKWPSVTNNQLCCSVTRLKQIKNPFIWAWWPRSVVKICFYSKLCCHLCVASSVVVSPADEQSATWVVNEI